MRPTRIEPVILWLALAPGVARAQSGPSTAGISTLAPVPVGPLIGNRGANPGAIASLRYVLPGLPSLGIRVEAAGLPTSSQANRPFYATNMITNGSSALLAGIGPELSAAVGTGHAYATAAAGIARVWATSTLSPDNSVDVIGPFASETKTQATNFAWSTGGGIVIPLLSGRSRAAVDIGVRYYDIGRATYTTDYGSYTLGIVAVDRSPVGAGGDIIAASHHRTTFIAPSIGIVWHY